MNKPLNNTRYSDVDKQKSNGATYTPKILSRFLANQMVKVFELPKDGVIRVLDPACGDGALLDALIRRLPSAVRKRLVIFGFDTDMHAIQVASKNLADKYPDVTIKLEHKDFLDYVINLQGEGDLFSLNKKEKPFHLVIANPPYVRTQVMGAKQAKIWANNFKLSGRVDLYYPFVLGISQVLSKNGIAGVITSNRFMTTKSGQDVRREMLARYNLLNIWDLGDTKLFDAAVLPSVFVAGRNFHKPLTMADKISFSSIYETKDHSVTKCSDVLKALEENDSKVVEVKNGRRFRIRSGTLSNGNSPEGVWRVATEQTDQWLATVEKNTWNTFNRIGKIRVGVKSTADKVFLRSDWDSLPSGRPELLRPLITRKCTQRFKAKIPEDPKHRKEILYPHEVKNGKRSAVDLSLYPKASKYLEQHRDKLESREYLIKAGRNWYELWGPQDPAAWSSPKLVFPDIAEKPMFMMDTTGSVVNGECYWLRCKNEGEQDLLWLALAVANSSFIEVFYDHRFNNKLYAGKRRFITQYVELFPLPSPDLNESKTIINLAKDIYNKTSAEDKKEIIDRLDNLIWCVFGLR